MSKRNNIVGYFIHCIAPFIKSRFAMIFGILSDRFFLLILITSFLIIQLLLSTLLLHQNQSNKSLPLVFDLLILVVLSCDLLKIELSQLFCHILRYLYLISILKNNQIKFQPNLKNLLISQ